MQPGLQAGPAPTSPPAPQPAAARHHAPAKEQKLPALEEESVVDTEINKVSFCRVIQSSINGIMIGIKT